jgi:hypothetical protein
MPDFVEDYLSETRNPHVNLSVKSRDLSLSGDYEFGLQSGVLNFRFNVGNSMRWVIIATLVGAGAGYLVGTENHGVVTLTATITSVSTTTFNGTSSGPQACISNISSP